MTLSAAPWAIDGALTPANLARRAQFANLGRAEGVVEAIDLKVTQKSTPGQGLMISAGNAVILNRYQDLPNQSYVVANDEEHEVLSSEMPTSQPTPKSYLVLLTIGDPEFSQIGHPWMPSDELDETEAQEFVYVRPYLIEVAAGTTSFADLGLQYPAIPLARVDIPASTTTITDSMIHDLRHLVRPRTSEVAFFVNASADNHLNVITPDWEAWPTNSQSVAIPDWATKAVIDGWIEAVVLNDAVIGRLRVNIVGGSGTQIIAINRSAPTSGADRTGFNLGGEIDVSTIAGTTKTFRIEASCATGDNGNLSQDTYTSSMMKIRFEEAPI